MTNPQPRKHALLDRHSVLGAFLLMGWGYLLPQVLGIIALIPTVFFLDQEQIGIAANFAAAGFSLVVLLIHRLWFRPEFKGTIFTGGFLRTLRYAAAVLVYWAISFAPAMLEGNPFQTFTLSTLGISLAAGFLEETVFRALPISYLCRQWRSEKRIPVIVILTSVCFGLMHLTNLTLGASLSLTIVQVIGAGMLGVFFAAVYLRGGNIFPLILAHMLHDLLSLAAMPEDMTNGILSHNAEPGDYIEMVWMILLGVWGLFLIRRSKRAEILAIWDEKWSRSGAPQTDTEQIQQMPTEPNLQEESL